MTDEKSFEAHLSPMLAKKCEQPFSDPEWLFEVKLADYKIFTIKERVKETGDLDEGVLNTSLNLNKVQLR